MPAIPKAEELDLIAAAQAGDRDAFNELIAQHYGFVQNIAWRLLGDHDAADDLTQNVCLMAWRKIRLFENRSRFSTWLYRITVNLARNHQKSERRKGWVQGMMFSLESDEDNGHEDGVVALLKTLPDTRPSPRETAIAKQRLELINAALEVLQPDHCQVLRLCAYGLEYEEMAAMLEINLGTLKSRICRARDEMGKLVHSLF